MFHFLIKLNYPQLVMVLSSRAKNRKRKTPTFRIALRRKKIKGLREICIEIQFFARDAIVFGGKS